MGSHPTMGAWIEISMGVNIDNLTSGRTPRWVRGLKYLTAYERFLWRRKSHPTMGAWIEIQVFLMVQLKEYSRTPRWVRGLK